MEKRFFALRSILSIVLGAASLEFPGAAVAATVREPDFAVDPVLAGLGTVTALAFAPDGTLFFTEKGGKIQALPPGQTSAQAFATLSVYTTSECGLLGIALGPDYLKYGEGGHVYVFATVSSSEQRIIRFRDTGGTGEDRTDLKAGLPTLGQNHDGGCLRIGPDGMLYSAIGDGGSGSSKAQDVKNLFGKVIRLNIDGTTPVDNPDLSAIDPAFRPEIFAYGFRNPFRLSFRKSGPAPEDFQLFVNDVGSSGTNRQEEVNIVVPGKNYGWPVVEGIAGNPSYVDPIWAYHDEGSAIVGGTFYEADRFPAAFRGNFFFMDYTSNKVFRMVLDGDRVISVSIFADAEGGLIDLAQGPDGSLYYSTAGGRIFRIRYEKSALFLRADSNSDGALDLSDAVFTLNALFLAGEPWACADAADANDDGTVDISDALITLFALFEGSAIPPPVGQPGVDPTADGLGCRD